MNIFPCDCFSVIVSSLLLILCFVTERFLQIKFLLVRVLELVLEMLS